MRLDHLLSKEEEVGVVLLLGYQGEEMNRETSGGDALRGNTRPHPEHEG